MDTKTKTAEPTPRAKWAQDARLIFLTICLEDCKTPKIDINRQHLTFEGAGGSKGISHKLEVHFLKEIDIQESRFVIRDREIEFVLMKKEQGPFWTRLVQSMAKQHWLRVDFERWKEEDDSEEDEAQKDLSEDELNEKRYGRPPLDFKDHISENVSKGSCLCPLGSAIMGKAMKIEQGLNDMSEETGGSIFDLHGFDQHAPDSDDDPLSDIEETPVVNH